MVFDALIPSNQREDFESFQKSRILIAIILICNAIFLSALAWVNFAPDIQPQGQFFGNIICGAAILGYCFCLVIFHLGKPLSLTAHAAIVVSYTSILAGITVSGGPLFAPATVMILLPIIMAFILINTQAGLIWTLIIMILHISMVLLHTIGFQYPQLLSESMLPVQHLAHWFMAYTAIIALMYFSDAINDKLQQALNAKQQHFEHLASHDTLTCLANRFHFNSALTHAISRSKRSNQPFALLSVDLDHFKPINDKLGHGAGDIVLKEVAQRLKAAVRDTDTVARVGGDEFAIILEELEDSSSVKRVADLLTQSLSQPITTLDTHPQIGASIGISIYPYHSDNEEQLIRYADMAMYQAKQKRGTWQIYQAKPA